MTNKTNLYTVILCGLVLTLASCSGKKNKTPASNETAEVQNQNDITRPPEFQKRTVEVKQTSPDETVSYDTWKKQQQERE